MSETHAERTARLMQTCPAIAHLTTVLNKAIAAEQWTEMVQVHDGEEWHKHPITAEGVKEAVQWVLEIDGVVTYRVGDMTFACLYDGPYESAEQGEEIVMDCNDAAGKLLGYEV